MEQMKYMVIEELVHIAKLGAKPQPETMMSKFFHTKWYSWATIS